MFEPFQKKINIFALIALSPLKIQTSKQSRLKL